jgi:integrase
MKINRLDVPSRTETSYGEVKMNLFVPPGGKTRNFYVRVYIPAELVELYGTVELKQSTRTSDRMLANARAAAFVLEKSKEFLVKRESLKELELGTSVAAPLDAALIQRIADLRLANLVRFDDEERDALKEDEDWDGHEALINLSLDELRKIIARRKAAPAYETFRKHCIDFADDIGHDVALDDPMLPAFIEAMVLAEKRAFELMAARSQGEMGTQLQPGEAGPWLRELLADWEVEQKNLLPDKTVGTYKSRIQHFIDFSHDMLVIKVERKDVWSWMKHLIDIEKKAEVTVKDGYLPALRSLFNFAVRSGKYNIKDNPAKGIQAPKLDKKEAAARSKPRLTFNKIYVNLLFSSVWYEGKSCPVGKLRSLAVTTGPARYWVPLIACFQGLRAEEICQLTLVDVGMQSGVFSIQISCEAGSVKNPESERWVPVHKQLLALGFEEFVKDSRNLQSIPEAPDMFVELGPGEKYNRPEKAGALFPELHTGSEKKSNAVLKKFNDFLRVELKFEKGYSGHSFRHFWEDEVNNVTSSASNEPWPKGMRERLSGRSQAHLLKVEGSSAGYGKPLAPSVMAPYLNSLKFDGLNLPKPWGEFSAS